MPQPVSWYKIIFHPNAITVFGLCLLPGILLALVFGEKWQAFVMFLFAEATDIVDGRLARRWKLESELGALLDTLRDKLVHLLLFGYFIIFPKPDLPHYFLLHDILIQIGYERVAFITIAFIEVLLLLSRTSILDRWRTNASNKAGTFGKIKAWVQALSIGGYIIGTRETVTVAQCLLVLAIIFGMLSLSSRMTLSRR